MDIPKIVSTIKLNLKSKYIIFSLSVFNETIKRELQGLNLVFSEITGKDNIESKWSKIQSFPTSKVDVLFIPEYLVTGWKIARIDREIIILCNFDESKSNYYLQAQGRVSRVGSNVKGISYV